MGYLEGKVVAVTGAGRGIGRSIALDAAKAGAKIVVADYGVTMDGSEPSSAVADEVVAEIKALGGEAVAAASDVGTMTGGGAVVEAAMDTFGRIDGAVCVAGVLTKRTDASVKIHLLGGDLELEWRQSDNHVYKTGPAREVFSGIWKN